LLANFAVSDAQQKGDKKPPPPPKKVPDNKPDDAPFNDAFTQVYILLAAANHDYGGHRGKAADAVKAAIHKNTFKDGTIDQQIKDQKGRNAELAKVGSWDGRVLHDKFRATDYQLYQARAMLTDVASRME